MTAGKDLRNQVGSLPPFSVLCRDKLRLCMDGVALEHKGTTWAVLPTFPTEAGA